jgi:hypothetical protein
LIKRKQKDDENRGEEKTEIAKGKILKKTERERKRT